MKRNKIAKSNASKPMPPFMWLILLGVLILIFVFLWYTSGAPTQKKEVTAGTTAGIVTASAGTIFIVENGTEKLLCGVEHILAEQVTQIHPDFELTGSFQQMGRQESAEKILCGSVSTQWNGFQLTQATTPSQGDVLRVFAPGGQSYSVSFRSEQRICGDLGCGPGWLLSGTNIIRPSMSGAPITFWDNQKEVVALVVGGDGTNIYAIPYQE